MVAQLATFHAPDDLLIGVCVSDTRRPRWEWAKWLPHALHPSKTDAVGPVRLFAPRHRRARGDARRRAGQPAPVQPGRRRRGAGPHVVVIIDGGSTAGSDHLMTEGGVEGVTLIDLSNPPPRLLDDSGGGAGRGRRRGHHRYHAGRRDRGRPGRRPRPGREAEVLARELAPLRLSAASLQRPAASPPTSAWPNCSGSATRTSSTWPGPGPAGPTATGCGYRSGSAPDGRPIELDLKESAQDGMGPHGLLVGATGSGKSELLRTLVLALAVTHSSEILNFVLVDFKGGATFAALDKLPHTSAVITNLEDELPLVDRMLDAIQGELVRRQELLRQAGNYDIQRDYERARAAGVPLRPLPSLLIICDEFSELLTARPGLHRDVRADRPGRPVARACTCCSPRSGWRRAGCAAWRPTCPTGSACGRSPPWTAARCSAYPTPTSCPARPATGTSRPVPRG